MPPFGLGTAVHRPWSLPCPALRNPLPSGILVFLYPHVNQSREGTGSLLPGSPMMGEGSRIHTPISRRRNQSVAPPATATRASRDFIQKLATRPRPLVSVPRKRGCCPGDLSSMATPPREAGTFYGWRHRGSVGLRTCPSSHSRLKSRPFGPWCCGASGLSCPWPYRRSGQDNPLSWDLSCALWDG